jgi:hypothetical protein
VTARYRVFVEENRDPESRYEKGIFDSADAAVAVCRQMVDADLADLHQPGMTAEALFYLFRLDGRDPWIVPLDGAPGVAFRGWDYAEARAAAICDEK